MNKIEDLKEEYICWLDINSYVSKGDDLEDTKMMDTFLKIKKLEIECDTYPQVIHSL